MNVFLKQQIVEIETVFDSSMNVFNIQLRLSVGHLTLTELADISPRKFSANFVFISFISVEYLPRIYDN